MYVWMCNKVLCFLDVPYLRKNHRYKLFQETRIIHVAVRGTDQCLVIIPAK